MELIGVGYKAEKKGNTLVMNLGYSHPVEMVDPEGITTEVPKATEIIVRGADKALVGNYAANIRAWRKPEPYKGKGIKYVDEVIRRKEGKTGK
jgi:large subunit ribosomal protein L6